MARLVNQTGAALASIHTSRKETISRIADVYPDIAVIIQYGAGDQLQSTEIAKSILTADPGLNGIFVSNEGSAVGVVIGVRESGEKEFAVIGLDSCAAQKDGIRFGLLAGAITNPVGIGYERSKLPFRRLTANPFLRSLIRATITTIPITSTSPR